MRAIKVLNAIVRLGAMTAGLVLVAACGNSGPTSPTPVRVFPPLSGPSRTFVFDRELSHPVSEGTKRSRFILYDNGAFVLQYLSLTGDGYRGSYVQANADIGFEWEGWSIAGDWAATGILQGDSLTVRYNLIMQLTDFEDAAYVLVR